MLKLLGMIFLFLILFFVVSVLCLAYRVRATLRSLLKNQNMQMDMQGKPQEHTEHDPGGMVIDVKAEKR